MEKGEYIEKKLERLFRIWLCRISRLGAVLFIGLSFLDYVATPENFEIFFAYRVGAASILIIISVLSGRLISLTAQYVLAYSAIVTSAITIELMILKFGGHQSIYYTGMILVGISVFGFIPARFSFHVVSAIVIYLLYLIPILVADKITDFRIFFTANCFIISVFFAALGLRYFYHELLMNVLSVKDAPIIEGNSSGRRFNAFMERLPGLTFMKDKTGNLHANEYYKKLFGDLRVKKNAGIFPADTAKEPRSTVESVINEGQAIERIAGSAHEDGVRYRQDYKFPVMDENNNPIVITGVSMDIAESKRIEDQLRLVKMAVDSLGIGLTVKDMRGVIIYTNPAEARMHGYDVDELIGKDANILSMNELRKPASFENLQKFYMRESINIRKDGSTFPVRLVSIGVRDEKNIPIGVITMCEDIAELKRKEEVIKNFYQMNRDILEKSPYGIFVVNKEGGIDFANPAMLEMCGETYEEFIRLNIHELQEYKKLGVTDKIISLLDEGKPFYEGHVKFTSFYGKKTTIRNFSGISLGASNKRKALIFVEDITERVRVEEEYARLAVFVEAATEAIIITDTDGIIQYVNPAFERMTGYMKHEVLGQTPRILKSGRNDDEFYKTLWETIKRGEVWTGHFINKKKDGTLYEEDATITPVKGFNGEILNYLAVKRDVTEKIRLESIAQTVDFMNSIGYIFSGIRHEIGNPVNSVKLILRGLKDKWDGYSKETILEHLDLGITEIARVEYLLKSLKSFNMYESLGLENVQISSFIGKFLSLVENDFDKRGIAIKTIIHPQAEWIYADSRALNHVMLNILTNAADALEGREDPKISISIFKMKGRVIIRVVDNGCGIPENNQNNIFQPFFTTKASGTGLGLMIAKKMLAQMNGTIDITSQKDAGSIVDISIPEGRMSHV